MFKFAFSRFIVAICLTFLMSLSAFADTIRLKDGSIIKGKIVNFSSGKFTVVIGDEARQKQMTFTADEVESIVFDTDTAVSTVKTSSAVNKNGTNDKDSTVIIVGQNNKMPDPAPDKPEPTVNAQVSSNTPINSPINSNDSNVGAKPITIAVKVLADNTSNGWTNSGFVVQKGQRIKITASGRISLGNGHFTTPIGAASVADEKKLIKESPTGGLIVVIGDDNNDFIFIGESHEFVATRDGALFLGVNEGNLEDNSGTFEAKIEIFPVQ